MITFRGRTFEYRETLKDWGARWDNDTKCWSIGRLSPAQRATVHGWLGVTVSGDEPDRRPITRIEISDEEIAALFPRADPEPEPESTDWKGITPFYGDDPTWMGYFLEPKPTAFFGFSKIEPENLPVRISNANSDD